MTRRTLLSLPLVSPIAKVLGWKAAAPPTFAYHVNSGKVYVFDGEKIKPVTTERLSYTFVTRSGKKIAPSPHVEA